MARRTKAPRESSDWVEQLASGPFYQLLERLPGIMLFAKDDDHRLRMGNPAFVARCGKQLESEIVGCVDEELFSERLAQKYRRDDERVLKTGEPMLDLIELFPNRAGTPEWSVTDKFPLYDLRGRIIGLCGTVRSYEGQRAALQPYLDLAPVAEYLQANFRKSLNIEQLAELAGLSVRQFGRKFRATFQMTPRDYLMQLRVIHACELLGTSNRAITEIALESGFYDHADFARKFQRRMGMTATAYRRSRLQR